MRLEKSVQILRAFISTCDSAPGIYKMLNDDDEILYVGKAKNLKSRLSDYLQITNLTEKTRVVIANLRSIETIVTSSEYEAILLEANLIKKYKPKYNILLKDSKSFPYICIDESSNYPKIIKYRGLKKANATYWGPFASASKIDEVVDVLQKSFLLRNCGDHFFAGRKRPCILYQMKRCSGPCVGKISVNDYADLVRQAKEYLEGKDDQLHEDLKQQMKLSSQNMEYEKAMIYRDRLEALDSIKAKQIVNLPDSRNFDVIVVVVEYDLAVVEVFFIRDGINLGNKVYYFESAGIFSPKEILSEFLYSFYADNEPAEGLLSNVEFEDVKSFIYFIKNLYAVRIHVQVPIRGVKRELVEFALNNAQTHLSKKIASSIKHQNQFREMGKFFGIEKCERVEVYDNSHFSGDQQVGVMVVCEKNGFNKSEYRKYNIKTTRVRGDDHGMMKEVLERRFKNASAFPDFIIIDGGYGQLSVASKVLRAFDLNITMIAMAKGEKRNSGEETIYLQNGEVLLLDKYSKLKQYLQTLRDEAHRFAITSNRKKMESRLKNDTLKRIPGIGDKTQKILLEHFGSLSKITSASLDQLSGVRGLSKKNAQNIYQYFRTSL